MTTLDEVLGEISELLEQDYTLPSGRVVHIRELTAAQRLEASQAAQQGGRFDAALFNAIIVQMGTVTPAIPKETIPQLLAGRAGVVSKWSDKIWALSEATPEALKSGDLPADDRQQDAGAGAAAAGADSGGDLGA